jgi:two-component system chemotaxis sensor kinase CheA
MPGGVTQDPAGGNEFLAEAEDLLESLGHELQQVDQERRKGKIAPQRINALFRHVHSLKGLAGMFGLQPLTRLTHDLEDFLDALRMGRFLLDENTLDVLFEAHERIEAMLSQGAQAAEAPAALLDHLTRLGQEHAVEVPATCDLPAEMVSSLTRYEEHRLRENIRSGHRLWLIGVSFPLETFDAELRQIVGDLNQAGEVISTLPCYQADSDEGSLSFRLLFGGAVTAEDPVLQLGDEVTLEEVQVAGLPDSAAADQEAQGGLSADQEDILPDVLDRASVRVGLDRLDRILEVVGELLLFRRHIEDVSRDLQDKPATRKIGTELHRATGELDKRLQDLQRSVIGARMVPVARMEGRLSRLVRKLARASGKEVVLRTEGAGTELDKMMIDRLQSPLIHLVRNAIHHGIETPEERLQAGKPRAGSLKLSARQRGNEVVLTLADDGRGLDLGAIQAAAVRSGLVDTDEEFKPEQAHHLVFKPGFTSESDVGEISGRGVGLDVVKRELQALGGAVSLSSETGLGTQVEICLPITLAIMPCMVVRSAAMEFAMPVASISETLRYQDKLMETVARRPVMRLRGETMPYADLRELIEATGDSPAAPGFVVVARVGSGRLAMGVDELMGQHEIVIKPVGRMLDNLPGVAGATELGAGRAALVLDMSSLAAAYEGRMASRVSKGDPV